MLVSSADWCGGTSVSRPLLTKRQWKAGLGGLSTLPVARIGYPQMRVGECSLDELQLMADSRSSCRQIETRRGDTAFDRMIDSHAIQARIVVAARSPGSRQRSALLRQTVAHCRGSWRAAAVGCPQREALVHGRDLSPQTLPKSSRQLSGVALQ